MADPRGTQGGARAVSWLGAVLFAASLAYFLFSYLVTFREIAEGPVRWRDAGIDVALFSLFALHHSVFARSTVRAWMVRRVGSQLERPVYVWIASLMLIFLCASWRPVGGVAWTVTGPAVWALRAALLAGVWLTLRSAAIIDVWDLAGVRQAQQQRTTAASEDAQASGPVFRVEGPYAWVRHPIYSGWFLIVFSVTPMTTTRLLFALTSCAYLLIAIPLEERTLRRTSAGEYDRYARQVKWKLVPWVY